MQMERKSSEFAVAAALGWVVTERQIHKVRPNTSPLEPGENKVDVKIIGTRPASPAEQAMWGALIALCDGKELAEVWSDPVTKR